jgi:hypothetical protein
MPPSRKSSSPRSYGRQATGRTIKSLSLDSDLAAWAEAEAAESGIAFSALIEQLLSDAKAGSSVMREDSTPYKINPPDQPQ